MKLKDFTKLSDLDTKFSDPVSILFDEDDSKKKKKKKKDKEKSKKDYQYGDAYEASLKELKKKDLRKKAQNMGIDITGIEDDKKAMRKAIMKGRRGAEKPAKKSELKLVATNIPDEKPAKKDEVGETIAKVRPPYYYDEDTKDFVITKAIDVADINCFRAMQSLGKLRKKKRPDDGFGELMDRIETKIKESKAEPEVIDVECEVVEDVKALPAPAESDDAKKLEEFGKEVDAALAASKKAKKHKK